MFSYLTRQVTGHEVHVVGEVLPHTGDSLDFRLTAEFSSVPTSRATRVTSDANDESWSTIVLIVFLSSRISPRTST